METRRRLVRDGGEEGEVEPLRWRRGARVTIIGTMHTTHREGGSVAGVNGEGG